MHFVGDLDQLERVSRSEKPVLAHQQASEASEIVSHKFDQKNPPQTFRSANGATFIWEFYPFVFFEAES